jgi:hypothetical protein
MTNVSETRYRGIYVFCSIILLILVSNLSFIILLIRLLLLNLVNKYIFLKIKRQNKSTLEHYLK